MVPGYLNQKGAAVKSSSFLSKKCHINKKFAEYVTLRKKPGSIGFTQCFQAFDGESDQNTDGLKRG